LATLSQSLKQPHSGHPYHWPVMGYERYMKNWNQQDLERYFKTYYALTTA
jgi:predicted Zn-dependent peptidase